MIGTIKQKILRFFTTLVNSMNSANSNSFPDAKITWPEIQAHNNTAFGNNALATNLTGSFCNAFGAGAAFANTTGLETTAFGCLALASNTIGSFNAGFGNASLELNTTGSYNLALGHHSLDHNVDGHCNIGIGLFSLSDLNGGGGAASCNVAIGFNTGRGVVTGANNTIIGSQISGLRFNLSNAILVATGDGSIKADYNHLRPNTWLFASPVACPTLTVASLVETFPANLSGAGARIFVSDSVATYAAGVGSIVVGGGTNFVPVYSDGTNWRVG